MLLVVAFAVKPREKVAPGRARPRPGRHVLRDAVARALPTAPRPRSAAGASTESVPRIDLARLEQERPETTAGRRNLFDFGVPPTPPPTPPPPTTLVDPTQATAPTPPPAPRLPALNLKYIGSVENARGVRVAVLLTDRNEVLTGQPGEVLANRYKIAKIGFESVDLEEVGSGQVRRIPLRGN